MEAKVRSADFRSTSVRSIFASVRRLLSLSLSISLTGSILTVLSIAPAFAYNTCGNVLGPTTELSDNTAKIKITPQHGTIFYIDSRISTEVRSSRQ